MTHQPIAPRPIAPLPIAPLAVAPLPADLRPQRIAYTPATALLAPYVPHTPAFAAGRDTPRAFLERCLAAMAAYEPSVRAFVTDAPAQARAAADAATLRWREGRPLSPVDGMPVAVKDMIETIDFPVQMNNPIYRDWSPRRDAAGVWALRQAGAVIVGKTVTTEFACGNSGPTRNPYDSTRTPGGSSSGSAAAVGSGMVALALGTQTHASTIRPASYCGAYALKATFGALHTGGVTPLAATLDHLGVFGASLEDLWAGAMAIARGAGGTPPHRGLQGGPTAPAPRQPKALARLAMRGWAETSDTAQAAFDAAIDRLGHAGVRILDAGTDPAVAALEHEIAGLHEWSLDILAWESRWPLAAYRAHGDDQVGQRIHDLLDRAAGMNHDRYAQALADRQRLRAAVEALSDRVSGFVALASSGPAIEDHGFTGSRSYAVPWTMVGGPAFALPLLCADSLPLGLQLAGFVDRDEELCAVAGWVRDTLTA